MIAPQAATCFRQWVILPEKCSGADAIMQAEMNRDIISAPCLKALLEPFGLTRFSTDYWGAYTRHLDPDVHSPGKQNTQKIERTHLTLRTRIKRWGRKTICFSKTTQMHDIVIGLFVNRYAFGLLVSNGHRHF